MEIALKKTDDSWEFLVRTRSILPFWISWKLFFSWIEIWSPNKIMSQYIVIGDLMKSLLLKDLSSASNYWEISNLLIFDNIKMTETFLC